MAMPEYDTNHRALVSVESQQPSTLIPGQNEWRLLRDMAASLVPTGFLPESIKTPEQAVAVMLKGRELNVPPMYALSNIAIVKGKPTVSAEMMLALIYRDHGKRAIRVRESSDTACTVEYRLDGWDDVSSYTFTIDQAKKANLTKNPTWNAYPAAMLRARCISAVARMAFPECIAGMYTPGELGDDVAVTDDGEVISVSGRPVDADTGEIHHPAINPDDERQKAIRKLHAIGREMNIDHAILHDWVIGAEAKRGNAVESMREASGATIAGLARWMDQNRDRAVKMAAEATPTPIEQQIEQAVANGTPTNGEDTPA